jgi:signal transduction histidine kinase
MDARGIAARIYDLPTAQRRAVIALLLALTVGASWWAVIAVNPDLPVSIWFPGSAAAVITVLVSRGRRVLTAILVAVALTLVGIGGGRSVELSLVYGLALGVEAWVVAQLLTRGRPHATMRDLNQMGWFLISSSAGVLVLVVVAGAGASIIEGVNPALIGTALLTSHLSAIVALVPIVLVPLNEQLTASAWEPILQSFTLVVLTVVVFGPAAPLAITFLLLTTLMWAASRFPPVVVAVQTIGLATAATIATSLDVGPFAVLLHDDLRGSIFALHLFILTHAAAGLFVAAQSAEWRATTIELAERERDALSIAHKLSQLSAQKDDFISAVSHELRTPVTSILGFSEQVIDAHLDPETEQAGRIIYRNARRLADVIEDVLELSRLSTANASNRPTAPVDMGVLLQDCLDDTMGLASTAGEVRVELQLPESPVVIQAVEQDLIRVFSNLVTNAVKFSPQGGRVSVTLTEADNSIAVSVSDEGPGIPLNEQEAVWERFYRVQSPQHRDVPGTGLGLPIVRSLLEHRIGGTITLDSDGVHGTTMVVQIPRTPPASVPAGQLTGA